jgi:raffinose/stachyose/melibiose transport system substrate-binding protein
MRIVKVKPLIMMLLMLAVVVAGCSSNNGANNAKDTPAKVDQKSDEPRTLKLMVRPYPNEVEKQQWARMGDAFEKQNEGVTVEFVTGDVAVESGKLTTMLNSGETPPDSILMYAGPARVAILSGAGLLTPLNDMYEANNWKDNLFPWVYDIVTLKDKTYELPHSVDYLGIGHNMKTFASLGIEYPTNGEEFYAVGAKLKEAGKFPIALGVRGGYASSWLFGNILSAVAGTENVEKLMFGEAKWTDEPFVRAAEELRKWVDLGIIDGSAVSLTSDDQQALFLQDKAGFETASGYNINNYITANIHEDVEIRPLPSFTEGVKALATGGVALTWVVPEKAKNKDLVEQWFKFIIKDYPALNLADFEASQIPATKAAFEAEIANPLMAGLIERLKEGVGYNPTVYIGNNTKEKYLQALQGLIGGLLTPQEAMALAEEGRLLDVEEGFSLK